MGKITLVNLIRRSWKKKDKYGMTGIGLLRMSEISSKEKKAFDPRKLEVALGEEQLTEDTDFKILNGRGINIKGMKLILYRITFDTKNLAKYDIQNRIKLIGDNVTGIIKFNLVDKGKGKNKYGKILVKGNTAINFRQTRLNNLMLTVRPSNYYDTAKGNFRLRVGWLLAKFCIWYNPVLLYEKQSSRYEESASVLYEKLVDKGYKKVKYIINRDNPKLADIDEKYKKQMIYKDTMKHIISFFRCKKFVGTETIGNAMQLRSGRKIIHQKTANHKNTFVFLQHGVMYMVSLSAEQRVFFKTPYDKHRVTASSELEKSHFVDIGEYKDEEIWITGLAKFDKSTMNSDADKIVIMPTWRSWELAKIREDFKNSEYYKFINEIVGSIPEELHDKIIVLPHPIVMENIGGKSYKLRKLIPGKDISYDDILKDCKLLITDYSSISYDAFYRGANVIFYWKDKEQCLSHYGQGAKLMLNERNAFGDVCYKPEELSQSIAGNYNKSQSDKMKKRYAKIVEFHDNKNTDRIIEKLEKEKII